MGSLLIGARLVLAAVLVVAGVAKMLDVQGSRRALAGFGVPVRALPLLAIALPVGEVGTAVALVLTPTAQWAGVGALLLFLAFSAGIANAIFRGRAAECHCFGQLHSAPATTATLIRSLMLAVPAGLVAAAGPGPALPAWVADRTAAELVAIAACVVAAVLGALAMRFQQAARALNRDLVAARSELDALPPGLPVGALAPGFALRSARHGQNVTLEALLARGRPVALIFVSPDCGPCAGLFADAGHWQAVLADDLTVALVSEGEPLQNLLAVRDSSADVLLQDDWEVVKAYRVRATPNAVVVSPEGRIASALVSGPGIESLIRLALREHAKGRSAAALNGRAVVERARS